jgi:DNA (cytosine-5)-methyltransferase 1
MNVVSLFSGAGGFDLGFIQAGHHIIWANDIDKDCALTYRNNIGQHFVQGDIKEISSNNIPSSDIIIGGFPCQGFSHANRNRNISDERNKLYLEFVRIVGEKKPKYFVAENVRGLVSIANGEVIAMIVEDFRQLGYAVEYRILNAADFGVPQNRIRVIIMGVRNDIFQGKFPFPVPTHAQRPELFQQPWVTISDALASVPEPDGAHTLKNHVYSKYKVTDRNFTGHRKTDPSKPSPTILAKDTGGNVATHHPKNHRRMSVRESAIIQTFPIDFEFFGSMGSMYRQIGNAVAVLFAKKIGEAIRDLSTEPKLFSDIKTFPNTKKRLSRLRI